MGEIKEELWFAECEVCEAELMNLGSEKEFDEYYDNHIKLCHNGKLRNNTPR